MFRQIRLMLCGALFLTTLPGVAWAQQPSSSVADLAPSLRPGDRLRITDRNGQVVEGAFDEATGTSLSVIVSGMPREFLEMNIRQVDRRLPDARWNGVAIGAGVGIASGLVWAWSLCGNDNECLFYSRAVGGPVFGGIGVGAGALIDFAIRKYEPVLVRPTSASFRVTVTPVISRDRRGIRVTASF